MDFKDRFKQLRAANKLAFAEIAAHFEKSEAAIRSWEMGKTKPDADTLIKLAKYFNCTTDYLLGIDEYKNEEEQNQYEEELESIINSLNTLSSSEKFGFISMFDFILDSYKKLSSYSNSQEGFVLDLYDILQMLRDASEYPQLTKESNVTLADLKDKTPYMLLFWENDKKNIESTLHSLLAWLELALKQSINSEDSDFLKTYNEFIKTKTRCYYAKPQLQNPSQST